MRRLILLCLLCIPAAADDGFKPLFDGKTLEGWDGEPKLWTVVDGAIRGKTTAKHTEDHSYLVWKGGKPENFELRLEFKIHGHGDSGVHYRSHEYNRWRLAGYQADMRNDGVQAGALYDVHGRQWLAGVGRSAMVTPEGRKRMLAFVPQTNLTDTGKHFTKDGWNRLRIVCRGNHHLHYVNDVLVIELVDMHGAGARRAGVIGLQLHAGPPMTAEYRNIRLKTLKRKFGRALVLFSGSLDGWQWVGEKDSHSPFKAEVATLDCSGKTTGYLRTANRWSDYILRLQLRYPEGKGGNSGVLLRVGEDKVWPKSIEAQAKTGELGYVYPLGDFPRKGAALALRIPGKQAKPLPGWNALEIDLDRERLKLSLNAKQINEVSGFQRRDGAVGLQSEGARVQFASIILIPIE